MKSSELRKYQIDIYNLSNKVHEYQFEILNSLFEDKAYSIVEKGSGICDLKLDKSETMIQLFLSITGKVELTCDRSLDPFDLPLEIEEKIIIKYGEEDKVLDDDIIVIRKDTPSINVSEYIYEFINLAVPMKKLHPRYRQDEDDEETMFYSSNSSEQDNKEEKAEDIDPRWAALKKLKDNK